MLTNASMIVPQGLKDRWRTRARRGALSMLKSLLEFRELVPEYKAEGCLMQAYREAAEAMLISDETLRDLMGKIREYPEDRLIYLINNGVSYDHMEKAHLVSELAGYNDPLMLLEAAVEVGNEEGKTMTVKEMTSFALGSVDGNRKNPIYHFLPLYERLGKFPTRYGWDEQVTKSYMSWLDDGKRFFK